MKQALILILLIFAVVVVASPNDAQSQVEKLPVSGAIKEGFKITATTERAVIQPGDSARIRVRIENTTAKPLYLAEVGPEKDYKVSVSGDVGRVIPLTEHGQALLSTEGDVWMNHNLTIWPGEKREDVLDVSSIYDMTGPGNHWIVVKRKVGKLNGRGVAQAESNTVNIQVW